MGKAPILRDRLFIAVLVALALACSSGEQGNDEPADVPAEASVEATSDGSPDRTQPDAPDLDEPDAVTVQTLEFLDPVGDDQHTCSGVDTCAIYLSANGERALKLRYRVDGVPTAGATIAFEVQDDTLGLAQLQATSALTDINGIAFVSLGVLLVGDGCASRTFKVKASVVGHPSADPLFFVVSVESRCPWLLAVSFVDEAEQTFDGVVIYLYKSSQPAAADLACADIDKIDLPTADLQKGPSQLAQAARFLMLPGLDDEQEQFYTIVARGELSDGTPVAFGCNDTDGHVLFTDATLVVVPLYDLPLRLIGQYALSTTLDLRHALPDSVQDVVSFALNVLEQPSASFLRLACQSDDPGVLALCEQAFTDPENLDVYALTPLGEALMARMEVFLSGLDAWTGYDVFGLGQTAGEALEKLTVPSVVQLSCEPDAAGLIADTCASAKWGVASWSEDPGQAPSPFAAQVASDAAGTTLAVALHTVPLKAGALTLDALQAHVLPPAFGDGADGQPAIDTFQRLFHALLSGRECLAATDGQPTCCQQFAEALYADAGGLSVDLLDQTCEAWVQGAAAYLESALLGLDPSEGDPAHLATAAPCALYDQNGDLKVDQWGHSLPTGLRCPWDLSMNVAGTWVTVEASFFGVEVQ